VASDFFPGQRVRLPARPDWGIGQVQSVIGDRVTVNFEHAGKVPLRLSGVELEVVEDGRG
jgi:FKBP-type peptidyl-prolyl cis-trans isomerase 2